MIAKNLPVYQHKDDILAALQQHNVIIIESPTGSGKTTQLPVILHEAGYGIHGVIGITQPRRIATLGVSSFIAKQLESSVGDLVGYKMRFEDKTSLQTRIKIMTDGILLQELRNDPLLRAYSVIMVDEAHERSLNIDFILGLLKEILKQRDDLKVIISSATLNTASFSQYFSYAPIVSIQTQTFPVALFYDAVPESDETALLEKIVTLVERIVGQEGRKGHILVFLSGEKQIKLCMQLLQQCAVAKKLWVLPLYGMLSSEEQQRVFLEPPRNKNKVIVSTNIAETSLTIDGVTSVIDSGLFKENSYNHHTLTSTLQEVGISQAANQRKGRAGRTQAGYCYRLYKKEDFQRRALFATEEIYRTDLSEVVLRMAGLGIKDYASFPFISVPSTLGIASAVDTLILLGALDEQGQLTDVGTSMPHFPLLPRHARMIVESCQSAPQVLQEICIITSFLSTSSPFLYPLGEEEQASLAQQKFYGKYGDFSTYLNAFYAYHASTDKSAFCKAHYLDEKGMAEIGNVEKQLEDIAAGLGTPVLSGGDMVQVMLCCGKGLVQFVCVMDKKRGGYHSLTADRVAIHPSSSLFKAKHVIKCFIAGEIMRTTRMFARSVAPLDPVLAQQVHPQLAQLFDHSIASPSQLIKSDDKSSGITIGTHVFAMEGSRKDKYIRIDWLDVADMLHGKNMYRANVHKNIKAMLMYDDIIVMQRIQLQSVLPLIAYSPLPKLLHNWHHDQRYNIYEGHHLLELCHMLSYLGSICTRSKRKKERHLLGFVTLTHDDKGIFWLSNSTHYDVHVHDSCASLQDLLDMCPSENISAINDIVQPLLQHYTALLGYVL